PPPAPPPFPYTTLFRSRRRQPRRRDHMAHGISRLVPAIPRLPQAPQLPGQHAARPTSQTTAGWSEILVYPSTHPVGLFRLETLRDRKSTRLNSSHVSIS